MPKPIHWGILGTGRIARKFAAGLACLPDARLGAVGSRSTEAAGDFAREFPGVRCHSSYAALAQDPEVDAIYIATPHTLHAANTRVCLEAGKPVLCEKPFTINAAEAETIIGLAQEKNLLLMEAMWTRFIPLIVRLLEILEEGRIGEVRMLSVDFGFRAEPWMDRLFDPALGGGALLDVGVYAVSLASLLFGTPSSITGLADLGPSGVDEQAAGVLGHTGGRLAVFHTAVRANTFQEASIMGTLGRIRVHQPWWKATQMTISLDDGSTETVTIPYEGNGYQFEAAAFMNCLHHGQRECDLMPLAETLAIMKTMDTLRRQWGLKYPME